MAMTKGAPDYPNGFDKSLYERAVQDGNVEDWSEVPLPALNTSYAVLLSDDLGIEADVYYGDSDEDFASGVGQYVGSAMFGCGKPILIGGHDTTYFAGLEDAKAGDTFTVQTNYGQYQYEVTDTAVAKATDASAYDLTQDSEQLILYTCYPFGKITGERDERFFVYAKRIDDGPVIRQQTADATSDADAAEEMEVTEDEQ
jgi:sortase A